jgi:Asp-tRNA(Asn)/Glu-tRNA(Gln) amidotransferase A subunit family amidase
MLRWFVRLIEGSLGSLIASTIFRAVGIDGFRRRTFDRPPTFTPGYPTGTFASKKARFQRSADVFRPSAPEASDFPFVTVQEYAAAYRKGTTTPEDVAVGVLEAIERSDEATPSLDAFIAVHPDDVARMARASTRRIQEGHPRSILEGVPVAVKDEIDMVPYPTSAGTSFSGSTPVDEDATVVSRLREAGALLLGKTNMHELGVGVTGHNIHYGSARNPYNTAYYTGGSSSGSAAAVAAGFCPLALGADAGGSIRIPASFCGVVGLKPTFGRVSTFGTSALTWSVTHVGPIAASPTDAAIACDIIGGSDPKDPYTLHQPPDWNFDPEPVDLGDLTIGIYRPWFRDADAEIVSTCEHMIEQYEQAGADLQSVRIPALDDGRAAHLITLGSELIAAWNEAYHDHKAEFGLDTRASLALVSEYTAMDYVRAQQYRTVLIEVFETIFEDVDVMLTPGTGKVAPKVPKAHLPEGTTDLGSMAEIMKFVYPANLAGIPAITYPVGYTSGNLPIGMQAMAGPWEESKLLRLALATERLVDRVEPETYYEPLVNT